MNTQIKTRKALMDGFRTRERFERIDGDSCQTVYYKNDMVSVHEYLHGLLVVDILNAGKKGKRCAVYRVGFENNAELIKFREERNTFESFSNMVTCMENFVGYSDSEYTFSPFSLVDIEPLKKKPVGRNYAREELIAVLVNGQYQVEKEAKRFDLCEVLKSVVENDGMWAWVVEDGLLHLYPHMPYKFVLDVVGKDNE